MIHTRRCTRLRTCLFLLVSTPCMTMPVLAQLFVESSDLILQQSDPTIPFSGAALADFNADGLLDLYHPGRLYRQRPDGTFENILSTSGINVEGDGPQGGVFGDINRDGLLDLHIPSLGTASRTWMSRTGSTFRVAPFSSNLSVPAGNLAAFFGNFAGSNLLDMFVVTSDGTNGVFSGLADGTFANVTGPMNADAPAPVCGASVRDADNDGDLDVFVTRCREDGIQNWFLRSEPSQNRFVPANMVGMRTMSSISSTWIDINNDGRDELFIANERNGFAPGENELYAITQQSGFNTTTFENKSVSSGISPTNRENSLRAVAADFDNDGWLDLFVTRSEAEARLLGNQGNGTFADEALNAFPSGIPIGTSVVAGDINNDGWVDLVLPSPGSTRIFLNTPGENNWLKIRTRSDLANRFAIGARIEVVSATGSRFRRIAAGDGSASQSDELTAHVGLGSDSIVDRIIITWPGGTTEVHEGPFAANQVLQFVEGEGRNAPPDVFSVSLPSQGGFIPSGEAVIPFSWEEATDPDGDIVRYTLFITGSGVDIIIPDLDEPRFELGTDALIPDRLYNWTVLASDGLDIRGAQNELVFAFGQPETPQSTLAEPIFFEFDLPNVHDGTVDLLDVDNDGDLDLFLSGGTSSGLESTLFRAEDVLLPVPGVEDVFFTFKTYVRTSFVFPELLNSMTAWADLDANGLPDLVITGRDPDSGQPRVRAFANTILTMTERPIDGVPSVWNGSMTAGDMDGDGDIDLLLTGMRQAVAPFQPETIVVLQENGSFTAHSDLLPGVMGGEAAWADIDGDGDLDVALVGDAGHGQPKSGVFRNDGGTFTEIAVPGMPDLVAGAVAWGDMDGDGRPDLSLSGAAYTPNLMEGVSLLFRNTGNGNFELVPAALTGVIHGQSTWVDYDGDGDEDLFQIGAQSVFGNRTGTLYRNDGSGLLPELSVTASLFSRFAAGDYNGDGDADIVFIGTGTDGQPLTRFLLNRQFPERLP